MLHVRIFKIGNFTENYSKKHGILTKTFEFRSKNPDNKETCGSCSILTSAKKETVMGL